MASYQARQRDPLLDQNIQAALERRGKELLGVVLLGLGVLTAMMLLSYSPDDPSWLAATDEPARNLLGRFGAALASPLFVIAGQGAWMIAVIFAAWGARFVTHRGEERALSRVIFAPIAVALMSVYASTHVAGPGWAHSFGLGGLFGDTVLGAILGIAPISATLGLKLLAFLVGVTTVAMALFVLGFDREDLKATGRFLLVGTVVAYDGLMRALGRARGSLDPGCAGAGRTPPRGRPQPRRRIRRAEGDAAHSMPALRRAAGAGPARRCALRRAGDGRPCPLAEPARGKRASPAWPASPAARWSRTSPWTRNPN